MKVDLPSGGWAEIREKLKAKDKFTVQSAVSLTVDGNANVSNVSGNVMTLMQTALLARVLDGWSLMSETGEPLPLPGEHSCPDCLGNSAVWHQHVADYIGETLELDDYSKLETIIGPYLDEVLKTPNLETSSG